MRVRLQLAEFGHIRAGAESMDVDAHDRAIVMLDHCPLEVRLGNGLDSNVADVAVMAVGVAWWRVSAAVRLLELWSGAVAVLGPRGGTLYWQPMVQLSAWYVEVRAANVYHFRRGKQLAATLRDGHRLACPQVRPWCSACTGEGWACSDAMAQ